MSRATSHDSATILSPSPAYFLSRFSVSGAAMDPIASAASCRTIGCSRTSSSVLTSDALAVASASWSCPRT